MTAGATTQLTHILFSTAWRAKPLAQAVTYPDPSLLPPALEQLSRLPPIVTPTEIHRLRDSLRDVALGRAFLLQGGDCAELFSYCAADAIDAKVKLLLQMSLVLVYGANVPVVRVARMAGQYAKPRSSPTEKLADGKEVASFRGDILNGYEVGERTLRPDRLVQAYFHSAATMNHVRAQLGSGFADLHKPLDWGLGHVRDKDLQRKYRSIVRSIEQSLRFMHTIGADTATQLKSIDLFASHEGLVLEYEEALVRKLKKPTDASTTTSPKRRPSRTATEQSDPEAYAHYATSAHFLWIGDRTRQLDGGHVEFFRGIENPIGIKVGPSMRGDELVRLLDIVDPRKQVGKVTLITRYGADKVEGMLGAHIDAVKGSGHTVVWQCDPMHGYGPRFNSSTQKITANETKKTATRTPPPPASKPAPSQPSSASSRRRSRSTGPTARTWAACTWS